MKFSELAEYFERLERTPSRLVMTEILAELFKIIDEDEIGMVVHLSLGQLRAKFRRLEFNLAEKMVMRVVAQAFKVEIGEVKRKYKQLGDLGEVVEELHPGGKKSDWGVGAVYSRLIEIAEEEGQGSQERKVNGLAELLWELSANSGKYVARMVVGKLRLGFSDMTVLDALSWMEVGDKSKRKVLESAYQYYPDVGEIAAIAKNEGIDRVEENVDVELGVPVVPALAQRLKTADEMIKKMGEVGVEPKFDGTRVQIHFDRKGRVFKRKREGDLSLFGDTKVIQVRTFTRNLDETTDMFPEIQDLGKFVVADELILDSEAVGRDPKTGKMLSFQETIKRKRKHGVGQAVKDIPLTFWVFDVLYKDGKSLVREPFYKRRKLLEKIVKPTELVEVDELIRTKDAKVLREFHTKQLSQGLEGAVVKKWDGVYEPGRRGWSWVKFKEAEESKAKLSDTVDAVVMGVYGGKGKRTAFGVGAFLVGIRSTNSTKGFEEGRFYTVSKVGTGLSDEQWRELKKRSEKLVVKTQPKEYEVDKNMEPDSWLSPNLVVEIAADEVTNSPIHTAKIALRFPRLVRFRDDKDADQVTSVDEVKRMA